MPKSDPSGGARSAVFWSHACTSIGLCQSQGTRRPGQSVASVGIFDLEYWVAATTMSAHRLFEECREMLVCLFGKVLLGIEMRLLEFQV